MLNLPYELYSDRNIVIPDIYTYDKAFKEVVNCVLSVLEDISFNRTVPAKNDNGVFFSFYEFVYKQLSLRNGAIQWYMPTNVEEARKRENVDAYYLKILVQTFKDRDIDMSILLDMLELILKLNKEKKLWTYSAKLGCTVDYYIDMIDLCFKKNGLGYRLEDDRVIRIDTEILHNNITKPTISLLKEPIFKVVNNEYLKAQEHYRNGNLADAHVNAQKAFESCMKIICNEEQFIVSGNNSSDLIDTLEKNGFIEKLNKAHLSSVVNTLKNGAPTIRNKRGGHGEGDKEYEIHRELTEYMLNLVGTNIIYLVGVFHRRRKV